jgi:hypothetical protein
MNELAKVFLYEDALRCYTRAMDTMKSLPPASFWQGADHAMEHIDSGSLIGHSAVMLSEAKHLETQRDRPFVATQGDTGRHLRLMRMKADQSAVCAINRHLQLGGIIC